MTLEAAFYGLLSTSIRRKAFVRYSTDGYEGTRVYSTAQSTSYARVVEMREKVLDKMGQETVTSHTAWVATTGAWGTEDYLYWRGSTWRAVGIDRMTDETGSVHHTKIRMVA